MWGLLGLRAPAGGRAWMRAPGSLWARVGDYSASMREEAGRRGAGGRAELLQVLEARVKQLRADNISEVTISRLEDAPVWKNSCRCRAQKVVVLHPEGKKPELEIREGDVSSLQVPSQPTRWVEKLKKEKRLKHKRQLKLQQKFSLALSPPGAEQTRLPTLEPGQAAVTRESQGGDKTVPPKAEGNPKIPSKYKTFHKSHKGVRTPAKSSPELDSSAPQGDGCSQPEKVPNMEPFEKLMEQSVLSPQLDDKEDKKHRSNSLLMSYLETCIFLRQPERAHQSLMLYHNSKIKKQQLCIDTYNIVMRGWAKKGALNQVGRFFLMLQEAGLKPNLSSYATALECMGRAKAPVKVIQRCVEQLEEDGYHLNELFKDSMYEEDEREMVLKALRKIKPDFQPPSQSHSETCTTPLLQDFYSKEKPVSYPKLDFSVQELRKRFLQQLVIEASGVKTIKSVELVKPLTEQTLKARELLSALRCEWRTALLQSLREAKNHMAKRKSSHVSLYPYLCLLEEEEYVDIMLQSLSCLPAQGESLLVLAKDLGTRVNNRFAIRRKSHRCLVKKIQKIYEDYIELLAKDTQPDNYLPREYWEKLEASSGVSLITRDCSWPNTLVVQLGALMVELLVQVIKMPSNILNPSLESKLIPVLYHVYSFRSTRQIGFIKPHPILTQILSNTSETTLTFDSFIMPMLCPPLPWTSARFGAYILVPTKLMRCLDGAVQHQLLLEECPRSNLHAVLDSLNQLSNCPWKINQPVLDIVISIFNAKGSEKLNIPQPLSEAPKLSTGPGSPWNKSSVKRKLMQYKKKTAEMYSLRMDALYKLSIANHMRGKVFWFPHNMDFRGRTYPCPPHFNHLGSDVTRAILLFAEGKPLGPRGLDWLKIHLINLTGLKKRNSLQERLAYANEIMEEILDSADKPMTGRKWWMDTDEPWQVLACCMEIAQASRSPDPAAYVSHFPIHQDGSCNGLQHYAALGRDVVGATSVNLMPCDVPQDVYSDVAQQVEEFRKQDAQQGMKVAQVLDGFIGRKVVKQTVMTVVYGVTKYGGRLQIEKRLKEINGFPEEYVWEASHYLVRQVFNSLTEMFSGTREIQSWLTESAHLIAKSGKTVEWVTPLGLPIVQPYHRAKHTVLNTSFQTLNLNVRFDTTRKPDTIKQKNAFPPNFIHSLDSTHMMLTALHCYRRGLMFVSVHDCYWTHALTVDVMNQVCREQFVALHSQPILQDLSRFMLQKYCSNFPINKMKNSAMEFENLVKVLARVPKTGDFDLHKVKESTYFFS